MWPFIQRLDLAEKPVTSKVIEFYVPKNFRNPRQPGFAQQLGKVIEFRVPGKKSA